MFRRICTACKRTVDWTPEGGEDGKFFHLDDKSDLCPDASVDLEVREQ